MPGALILLYHRAIELASDPQLMCVTPEHLAEQFDILQRYCRPTRLNLLAQALQEGNVPRRSVVVTFDDGYSDNLHNAKPLLERYEIPATVFVTTGHLADDGELWWDELERVLLQPGTLPEMLCLRVGDNAWQWELGETAHYSEDAYRRHSGWNVLEQEDPSRRQSIYRSLYKLLRPLAEEERRKVLDELLILAGGATKSRSLHRLLSPEEVSRLAEGGLVEIGAHTMTHSVLSTLPRDAQRTEIQCSKAHLEEILGRPVTSFSYPYGSRADYTEETVAIVREAGFACACSNFSGAVRRGTDPFQMPRVVVRDWDGETFARSLREWFRG